MTEEPLVIVTLDEGQQFADETAAANARLVQTHLQRHLTDGHWHDDCPYCLTRRSKGGTGVPDPCLECDGEGCDECDGTGDAPATNQPTYRKEAP